MKEWYQQTKEEILGQFQVTEQGLTSSQAEKILAEKGENVLEEGKRKSTLQVFLEQFCDLLVVILIIAALISMVSGNVESTVVILAVIILNAILGTVQHAKAEKSLDSLKSLSSPNAKVLRDGQKVEIPSSKVLPGDILYLEAGDLVVADGRILENYSLQVNESSLTGESTNVDKNDGTLHSDCALADRANMVYSSGLVTYGRAVVLVTATGMDTEIGKIAALMNATKEKKTPLQVSLDQFGSRLAMAIMVICALVFLLSLYRKMPVLDSLMFAVALAVAAIPEALSSIVTIVQAMGTQKMAKEHAIIKELKAVESLGCVSVICSDKTGTLTQNKMTVQNIYTNGQTITIDQLNLKNQLHRYLLYDAILTNDSSIVDGKGIGDPTEFALVEMGRKATVDENLLRELMPRLEEIPFDSDRKLMSTKYELHDVPTVLTKGALDVLLDRTVKIRMEEGIRDITREDREAILQKNLEFSQEGLRVLAFGYKEVPEDYILSLDSEKDFIFLGLISMMDPPREESKAAVADAKRAGIKPVMITGDHKITATAIAKQIGIYEDGDMAMTGRELDAMPEEELDRKITDISVYARVSPENKIRIVDAWQRRGSITAMTGDGVNDAPALKKADIGVAMGITGTEVSKDAAAMILTDDNFATIIKAVANGRNVYRNIKNAIKFLLSGNMAGILSVLYTSLAALPVPFAPVHLLFINLLTDSLPAIAIGMEPAEKDLLSEAPRNPKTGILTKDFMTTILTQGGIIAVCTMIAFHAGLRTGSAATASTMAFATLTLARLFHGFNCRSKHNIFKLGFSSNWYSLGAFAAGVVLLGIVMFVPFMQNLFSVTPLTQSQIVNVCILAAVPTVLIQLFKIIRDIKHRK
ncbi:ATPase [Enterocloster clostridioformis]|uniref:cation-translocating P-type ATPase n=2 Tax=Enterocloster clostridioformis TaxID=1531 RepID=UPI00080C4B38|nr:cation-translocating P-type ATPase [Enterocloster clostridioformis]ANU46868.1 ATPase [Lachnoclostridium sp. YL32]NDO26941.1 cation-translocating P-type ATPase [Enterocloster clostridioformis]OXE62457.1 ATPase [Enterocloster clostridioformis]QQQ98429.1 cation-translocating P-type ATPase [Enterocloster clostridioformis]